MRQCLMYEYYYVRIKVSCKYSCLFFVSVFVFIVCSCVFFFFFFQAEDGIRDYKVTGVQTCALPISIPEGGYHGEYLVELAATILAREGRRFADLPENEGVHRCREVGVESQRAEQEDRKSVV